MRIFVTGPADLAHRGSPDRGVSNEIASAVPDWAKGALGCETWQGRRLEIDALQRLAPQLPDHLSTQGDTISWRSADNLEMSVDLTPAVIVLALGLTELFAAESLELGSD